MNGIKDKIANLPLEQILTGATRIKGIKIVLILNIILCGCGSRDMEKETWIVPCNFTGTLTVYFNFNKKAQADKDRIYKFNNDGIYYSSLSTNEGFTPDFNQTLSIKLDCNGNEKIIKYFDNADSSKLKQGEIYATYFLTGKDSLYCETISILKKR